MVIWPLVVAVITLRCQYAFGVIYCHQVIALPSNNGNLSLWRLYNLMTGEALMTAQPSDAEQVTSLCLVSGWLFGLCLHHCLW
jgi:hypothetical protein